MSMDTGHSDRRSSRTSLLVQLACTGSHPSDDGPGLAATDRVKSWVKSPDGPILAGSAGVVLVVAKGSLHAFLDSKYRSEINTTTRIITFLMVAFLQNSQTRTDQATQHKLNAIADGLADLMERTWLPSSWIPRWTNVENLRGAVGLETREHV